jgi:ABC-type Fe3+-hydroxamate transport system substrate-binding protein
VAYERRHERSGVSGHPSSRERVPFVRLRPIVSSIAVLIAACGRDVADDTARSSLILDDFGDTIVVAAPPARIVSLNPATTELLFALGAGARLVGRTHWDEWPPEALAVPDLGPGVRPNIEAVLAARPDLVVLYASEDNRAAAQRLRAAGISTLSLKVDRIEHFERSAAILGRVLGDTTRGRVVVDTVRATLDAVATRTGNLPRPRVLWPVDIAPVIAIGAGSFLNQLIEIAGGSNAYADMNAVSPQLSLEDVHARDPDIILANPALAARIRAEPAWRGLRAVREGRVIEADEVLMGRPSVRMGEAAIALARLLHPEAGR